MPFHPGLMFASKVRAYASESPFKCYLQDRLVALPANIRLGYKGFPGTNTLAYCKKMLIIPIKSFITLGRTLPTLSTEGQEADSPVKL